MTVTGFLQIHTWIQLALAVGTAGYVYTASKTTKIVARRWSMYVAMGGALAIAAWYAAIAAGLPQGDVARYLSRFLLDIMLAIFIWQAWAVRTTERRHE